MKVKKLHQGKNKLHIQFHSLIKPFLYKIDVTIEKYFNSRNLCWSKAEGKKIIFFKMQISKKGRTDVWYSPLHSILPPWHPLVTTRGSSLEAGTGAINSLRSGRLSSKIQLCQLNTWPSHCWSVKKAVKNMFVLIPLLSKEALPMLQSPGHTALLIQTYSGKQGQDKLALAGKTEKVMSLCHVISSLTEKVYCRQTY